MLRVCRWWPALALVGAWLSTPVAAGPFRMLGHDSAAQGQGAPEVAWGHGPGVLYSNPALLTQVEEGFHVGFHFVQPMMHVDLMNRPANADVPITFYDSDVGLAGSNLERPLPTAELRIRRASNQVDSFVSYLGLGFVSTLGVEEFLRTALDLPKLGFRFGLAALVPTSGLLSIASQYPDEREQFFSNTVHLVRFGEWSQVLSLQFGLAFQPVSWLSIGLAAEGGLNVKATLDMYIPEATVQDFALVNAAFEAAPAARGVIGLAAQPLDWLSIGLVWRDRRFSEVDADAMLNLWNYHEPGNATEPKRVQQRHLLALDFEPMEVSLAVGVRFERLFAQASVTWNHWSDFIDTHHKRAQENAVWEEGDPADMRYEWDDTFSLALGLGYEYLDGLSFSAGGGWRPSPVPPQVGRTNYADADLFNVAAGHRVDLPIGQRVLRIDAGLQLWIMGETTVHKDPAQTKDEFPDEARTLIGGQPMPEAAGLQTNNPGFPGYTFGGLALAGTLTVAYLF
jgi:hypothetical protein